MRLLSAVARLALAAVWICGHALAEEGAPLTGTLKTVWNGGTFNGSYRRFQNAIAAKMPPGSAVPMKMLVPP